MKKMIFGFLLGVVTPIVVVVKFFKKCERAARILQDILLSFMGFDPETVRRAQWDKYHRPRPRFNYSELRGKAPKDILDKSVADLKRSWSSLSFSEDEWNDIRKGAME